MSKNKFQLIGEFTLGTEEKLYHKLNPPENNIETCRFGANYDDTVINIVNNGKKYIREKNPYEHMVNLNTQRYNSSSCFSFKAKSFYDKAVNYSKKAEKMDNYNQIYFQVYNPNENRYYKLNNIYIVLYSIYFRISYNIPNIINVDSSLVIYSHRRLVLLLYVKAYNHIV